MNENHKTAAASEYHRLTNHTAESVRTDRHRLDWSIQPRPYKLYANLPAFPLMPTAGDSSTPALSALSGPNLDGDTVRVPDLPALASILHYSGGIIRRLRFPGGVMDFRAAACTGALYHIELYVVCRDLTGLDAGVYHFGVHDSTLRRLRSGDMRAALVHITEGEPAVAQAPLSIVCTTTYWRNSWKYQARAYRHAFWDSGTILANMLALASAHDLPARLVTGFVDSELGSLLGLDPAREVPLVVVPLGRDAEKPAGDPGPIPPLHLETVPYSTSEIDYPVIRGIHSASSLADAEEVAKWRSAASAERPPSPSGPETRLPSPAPAAPPAAPIEHVIRRRGSARRFEWAPIGLDALFTLLTSATAGIPADFLGSPLDSLSEPYCIVRAVDGLESGAYVYHRESRALELLKAGDFTQEAGRLDLGQELAAQAAVNVYFLSDLTAALTAFGNRGYRVAQLDAAVSAGKLYLASYALGLGATGLTFYDDEVIAFFSPHALGKSAMFLLALGVPARRTG